MKITSDHWLDAAIRRPMLGGQRMENRRFLVMHFTSGATAESSLAYWRTPEAKGASAHLTIDRDGRIFQIRPFDHTCGHAGKSAWRDPKTGIRYEGLNSCSIGIEMANAGDSANSDGTAFSSHRFICPAGTIMARHKFGGSMTRWEVYPKAQLEAGMEAAAALVARYHLDDVIGHEDIAPDRKNDPGPAFPMADFRSHCGFLPTIPFLK